MLTHNDLRVREKIITLSRLPESFSGLKIAHISDLHFYEHTCKKYYQRVVDSINRLEPDIIAMTGDVVHHGDRYIDLAASFLSQINARLGKFGAIGNHDYDDDALSKNVEAMLGGCGYTVLRNKNHALTENNQRLWLAGVDDLWHGTPDLHAALSGIPGPERNEPVIMLSHNPLMFDPFSHHEAQFVDLTLSGHTHAGHVYIPPLGPIYRYMLSMKYRYGLFEKNRRQLYVTSGVGSAAFYLQLGKFKTGFPRFRFNTNPEIALLTLSR